MYKILSLILSVTIFVSMFSIASFAGEKITKEEAEALIDSMQKTVGIYNGDISEYVDSAVSDELNAELNRHFNVSHIKFYLPKEEYRTVEWWKENYLGSIFTEEFISQNELFKEGLKNYNGDVYLCEGYASAPGYPLLDNDYKSNILISSDATAMVKVHGYFDGTDDVQMKNVAVNFEYTDNGWRISGGEAVVSILHLYDNPQTSDNAPFITVCMLVSILGVSVTLKKRRHGYAV